MSIFDSIRDAIFRRGHGAPAPQAGGQAAPSGNRAPPSSSGTGAAAGVPAANRPSPPSAPSPAAAAAPSPPSAPVDVEAVLDGLARDKGQKLNWRSSIVDLLKLLDLDSGLEHRRALAHELGYEGDTNDSTTMNVWLHRQVMNKLAANGGRVPADLRD
jgi:hypothetical protein